MICLKKLSREQLIFHLADETGELFDEVHAYRGLVMSGCIGELTDALDSVHAILRRVEALHAELMTRPAVVE